MSTEGLQRRRIGGPVPRADAETTAAVADNAGDTLVTDNASDRLVMVFYMIDTYKSKRKGIICLSSFVDYIYPHISAIIDKPLDCSV